MKKGTPLFRDRAASPTRRSSIRPIAAEDAAKAQLRNSQAEFDRQADLVKRQVSTQANYDKALAQRDDDKANLEQAQANTEIARINYGYTQVLAPFDGVVTRAWSRSANMSAPTTRRPSSPPSSQIDPIWVNFNVSEQDVQRIRAERARQA